jgi:hypothetical protein
MLQVRAVERVRIQKDRDSVVERDAVFRRVGLGLPRVPLEHLFSIYRMWLPAAFALEKFEAESAIVMGL